MIAEQAIFREELDPLSLLRDRDLARRWHKSIRTLQRWRSEGYGPDWIIIGGSVRYRIADVLTFKEQMRRSGRNAK